MWRNYLTVGLRALAKNKTYAFLTIFGLALGLSACILILAFVRYEFSYDGWLPEAERTYQLQTEYLPTADNQGGISQTTAWLAEGAVRKDFPQVEKTVWAAGEPITIVQAGQPGAADRALVTDGALFDVLAIPFARGDGRHALDDPHAIVLSEKEATKRFGARDPIGQTLTLISGDMTADYRVSGVFKDIPKNSFFQTEAVARIDPKTFYATQSQSIVTSWRSQNGQVFVKLKPGADPKTMEMQLPAWKKRNIPDDLGEGPKNNYGDHVDFHLVNVRDIHLNGSLGPAKTADRTMIIVFGIVALLVLGMACINFTNLATARASQRAREVALRKVLGATRAQLIVQFLAESFLVTLLATILALALTELVLPVLNGFLNADIALPYFGAGGILIPLIGLVLAVGLAGGLYPAFHLSRFQPARILKANKSAADAQGRGRLRNILVVTQFAVSIGLIICTLIVQAQVTYARTVDPGFKRDHLLQVNGLYEPSAEAVSDTLVDQIRRLPDVIEVGRVKQTIASGNNSTTMARRLGATDQPNLGVYGIDDRAVDALGMKLLAGRNFSRNIATDDATTGPVKNLDAERALIARGLNVILSESAARRIGFASPQAAIGQPVEASLVSDELGLVKATVVGVVGDVNYKSVRQPVQPILYYYQPNTGFNALMIRFRGNASATRDRVEGVWKRLVPQIPFDSRAADDLIHDMYNMDEKRARLFGMFSMLAVVIGCLGLFGLAAFTAEQRTKEIGIRKVLGARTRDIVRLLVWQFSRPVVVANLIAWPVAWWLMRDWLNRFDNRITLGPGPFLLAGAVALGIAVLTVGTHAVRIARAKPIHALRYE